MELPLAPLSGLIECTSSPPLLRHLSAQNSVLLLVMRSGILRMVRFFGTQSDKDFFFHDLAKTGQVKLCALSMLNPLSFVLAARCDLFANGNNCALLGK
jgi:hypothetical protein